MVRVYATEGTPNVYSAQAIDPDTGDSITYSLGGTKDEAHFSIDEQTGAVTFNAVSDFEDPQDGEITEDGATVSAAGDNAYVIDIIANDGELTTTQTVVVNVTNVNEAPVFASDLPAEVEVDEDVTDTGIIAAATDADGDTITYKLGDTKDEEWFDINADTGVVSFKEAPNYEDPQDADRDNDYIVDIIAEDGNGASTTHTVTIKVQDIASQPKFTSAGDAIAEGFVINGIVVGDQSGFSVSSAGDVNGDGFDDLIIGAPNADPNRKSGAGQSYVVFGRPDTYDDGVLVNAFGAMVELSDLDGSNGFTINGIDVGDESGYSVSSAGDVNGDGIEDLIIGAPWADPNSKSNSGRNLCRVRQGYGERSNVRSQAKPRI